jgi:hypothetical protein
VKFMLEECELREVDAGACKSKAKRACCERNRHSFATLEFFGYFNKIAFTFDITVYLVLNQLFRRL